MKKIYLTSAALLAILSMAGCQSTSDFHSIGSNLSGYSPLEIVAQESQKALNAQQLLTKYKQAQNATLDVRQRSFETDKIVVDYIGKPRNLLSSIGIKYGYRFIEMGTARDLPIVNFTQVHGTPEHILTNLDAQLQNQAKIAINKNEKVITLIY